MTIKLTAKSKTVSGRNIPNGFFKGSIEGLQSLYLRSFGTIVDIQDLTRDWNMESPMYRNSAFNIENYEPLDVQIIQDSSNPWDAKVMYPYDPGASTLRKAIKQDLNVTPACSKENGPEPEWKGYPDVPAV